MLKSLIWSLVTSCLTLASDHASRLARLVAIHYFGTRHKVHYLAGLRAEMSAGWARMNDLIVIQTSQARLNV